jgi:hypothetical protein
MWKRKIPFFFRFEISVLVSENKVPNLNHFKSEVENSMYLDTRKMTNHLYGYVILMSFSPKTSKIDVFAKGNCYVYYSCE